MLGKSFDSYYLLYWMSEDLKGTNSGSIVVVITSTCVEEELSRGVRLLHKIAKERMRIGIEKSGPVSLDSLPKPLLSAN